MDSFLNNEEQSGVIETRWDRIERRHINSAIVHNSMDAANQICKNLIENKEFVTSSQLKAMVGNNPTHFPLNPNLVMDLRHSRMKRRVKSATSVSRGRAKSFIDERQNILKMFELNQEIQNYRKHLEHIRPKSNASKGICTGKTCLSPRSSNYLEESLTSYALNEVEKVSNDSEKDMDECNYEIENGNEEKIETELEQIEENEYNDEAIERQNDVNGIESQAAIALSPYLIPSECLLDGSYTVDEIEVNNFIQENSIDMQSTSTSACSSTQTELRTVLRQPPQVQQVSDNFELIIRPTITVNIQDTIRSNLSQGFVDTSKSEYQPTITDFQRESNIAVNQQMSIHIKKLSNEIISEKSNADSIRIYSTESNEIINQVLGKSSQEIFTLLQKYFLRWVHYNTIEKLKRRIPAQTRLQKMEAFLQNITFERKRALNKLRRPGNVLAPSRDDGHRKMASNECHMESPRLLLRTYNNKLKSQQDIIELQRIKLQRQQRIITEMKIKKLLDDTTDAEVQLKEQLGLVAQNGCANSRSKAKCLQIAGNLKNKDDVVKSELQAKGITAPKFLIEMQARALDREMRHQEAQRRREALDREKEALRIAAEEEKRLLDEQTKRDRIKEYWRKRRLEKELEEKKAIERMRYLANLEVAKTFNRTRVMRWVMSKFRNIVKWKIRNRKVSNDLRRHIMQRDAFHKWKWLNIRIWEGRKLKADQCYNRHCKKVIWEQWQQIYLVGQSKKLIAEDWFHLRLIERVFRSWERVAAQTRLAFEIKLKQVEAHFNWYMKWKVLEHWRRLHAILKIEKETEARRERWRSKIYELTPDYKPKVEFI